MCLIDQVNKGLNTPNSIEQLIEFKRKSNQKIIEAKLNANQHKPLKPKLTNEKLSSSS